MLHVFLQNHRTELIELCREKVRQRESPPVARSEVEHGIPLFLDQLIKTLQVEEAGDIPAGESVSGPSSGVTVRSEIGESAALHGRELLRKGFTIEQVVHEYGDVCQAVTGLAFERSAHIEVDEFRTLNRCLDNAIATAVSEFNYHRDYAVAGRNVEVINERLGFFAHELRNLLNTATLALGALKAGNVGFAGATGAVLDRSLVGLRTLIDRSLAEVRLTAGLSVHRELFSLADFISEVNLAASLEAGVKGCKLSVSTVDPNLALDGDRDLLLSAAGNLLQNAFKFTRHGTEVTLQAYAAGDRILIDVSDHCGGLGDKSESLFQAFTQSDPDKSGIGLGLSISRSNVEANAGTLTARDRPGQGCVFTIDVPRHALH